MHASSAPTKTYLLSLTALGLAEGSFIDDHKPRKKPYGQHPSIYPLNLYVFEGVGNAKVCQFRITKYEKVQEQGCALFDYRTDAVLKCAENEAQLNCV